MENQADPMSTELIANSKAQRNNELVKARMRAELGKQMEREGEVPFALENDVAVIEERTKAAANMKDLGDAELSYLLFNLREARKWADAGHPNFVTYCDAVLGMDRRRATTLATAWDMFLSLGLSPTVLGGSHRISWTKFRALRPAVNCGKINSANIYEYLPLIADSGPESMLLKDLDNLVKGLVAQAITEGGEGDEDDESTVYVKIGVPKASVALMHQYQEVISKGMGIDDAGRQVLKSLEFLSAQICSNDLEAAKLNGLVGLKQIAEALVPGLRCIFVADTGTQLTEEVLGITPVTRLFQGCVEGSRGKELVHVLASSEEEAKSKIGATVVREFPISLGDSITKLPTAATSKTTEELKAEIATLAKQLLNSGKLVKDDYYKQIDVLRPLKDESLILPKLLEWVKSKDTNA